VIGSDLTGLETWCQQRSVGIAVTVTIDNRGDGLTLYRRHDHPQVDFSRLEDHEAISFAHKNGFVAKTKDARCDWRELIRLAKVDL